MTTQTSTWHGEPPFERGGSGRRDVPDEPAGQRGAPGTVIGGRYQLRTAIGNGGMGTVWQAADTLLRRDVAVKEVLLPPGMSPAERDAMCERTLREARAAAALSHPSVVQVFDVVTEAGRPWIIMELLHARSLADIIVADGPLAPRAVAKIGIALLGALEVAHAGGVLHRDVKPANVLICTDGRCVLTDFGVARLATEAGGLTTPGMVLGSPHFISPERAIGSAFGPPSDLFSLGVTLYTAVEGQPPFDKGDPFETMRAVVEEAPTPPVRAGALRGVLYSLLEKDPARRADVGAARAALRELLAGPLSNNAVHSVTDPYAVMRSAQPPSWAPPRRAAPAPPATTGGIGGRAMLAPGETPADRVHRPRHGDETPAPASPGAPAATTAAPAYPAPALPYQAAAAPYQAAAAPYPGVPGAGYPPPGPPAQRTGPGYPPQAGYPGGYAPGAAPVSDEPATGYPPAGTAYGAGAATPRRGLAGMPLWTKAALAGGAAVIVLVAALLISRGGGGGPKIGTDAGPTAAATAAFPVQRYATHGATVNLPGGWVRQPVSGTHVDFTDPQDKTRWVRVDTYQSSGTGRSLLEAADRRFRGGNGCSGYEQIGLRDTTLGGQPAAELEYACHPSGDPARHGIWRAVVVDGRAYALTLSVPAEQFDASRQYYAEMVRSFAVSGG